MKDENRHGSFVPFLVSMLTLAATTLLLQYFYGKTFYVPFLLLSRALLLPMALSLIAWIFRRDLRLPKKPTARGASAPATGAACTAEGASAPGTAPGADPSAAPGAASTLSGAPLEGEVPPDAEGPPRRRLEWRRVGELLRYGLALARHSLVRTYNRWRPGLRVLCSIGAFVLFGFLFFRTMGDRVVNYSMNARYPILLLLVFVLFVILEKWAKHTETEDRFCLALLQNVRSMLAVARLLLLCTIVATALRVFASVELQQYLIYVYIVVFCYQALFLLFSFAVRLIRKDLSEAPAYHVPVPFMVKQDDDLNFVRYLEESTGITMRSLWSIKLIRYILPYTVVALGLCFWLSTGIVQVESCQRGAVYRLGVLQEETLSPGLHFVFPAPIDKVELYNTETVSKVTIGYRSEEVSDNIWTAAHGDEEYKLLLGNGNEVVSINLRLEYKISDLGAYLRNSACSECILEAMAYELVTDRTISTDLDTLLSTDRAAFAESFRTELVERIGVYQTGIEVVSVVLESIHPPVEIAETYQKMVSAEIQATQYILEAEGSAATILANAEITRAVTVADALSAQYSKIAKAQASVAEFMAAVEAYQSYPDSYKYNKYLAAITSAYNNARIVLVGEGVNAGNIYIGSLTAQ